MKQKFTLLLFFIFSFQFAFADKGKTKNLYEGFVITSMGDTVRGQVQFVNPVFNELKVRFYNEDGKRTTYKTQDIVEYSFLFLDKKDKQFKWVTYVRKRVDVSPIKSTVEINTVFLQRVTQGQVTLYNYYTLETSKINSREYIKNYYVEQQTPNGFDLTHVDTDNFREYARTMLASNDELFEQLGTSGFGYRYFADIVKEHNKFLNGEEMSIVAIK
jgi:hypothetical protein